MTKEQRDKVNQLFADKEAARLKFNDKSQPQSEIDEALKEYQLIEIQLHQFLKSINK